MKQKTRVITMLSIGAIGIVGAFFYRQWKINKSESIPTEWTSKVKEEFKSDVLVEDYSAFSKTARLPDWSQFLGPRRDGALPEAKIAKKWPKDGPKVLWTVKIGGGFGGASIRDNQVFLADRQDDERDVLRCFDLNTGKEKWSVTETVKGRLNYNGSRSVPTVTKDTVLTTNLLGWIYAISRSSKKTIWKKNLAKEYATSVAGFGFAHSALSYEGMVIYAPCSKTAGLIALEESTGKEIWKSEAIVGNGYVSPIIATIAGQDQALILTSGGLYAFNPKDGTPLWNFKGYSCNTPIPAPTVLNDGRIFITGGYKAGSVMISVAKDGEKFLAKELFRIDFRGSQIQPVLFYKNHLYANFNQNANIKRRPDGLVCMDLNGKLKWQTKKEPGIDRGSLILLGDSILTLGGQDGVLRLIETNSEKYVELASSTIFKGKQMWAPMAFFKGKLVLRSQKELKCLELNP